LLAATHGQLVFVRLTGDVLALQSDREFVPYFLEAQAHGHWMALGLASTAALGRCIARGFQAAVVPLDPHTEDPLLVHLDKVDREAQAALGRVKVLYSEGRRLLVGVGPDLVNDDIALHGAHGHYVVLWPEPLLWDRSSQRDRFEPIISTALGRLPQNARQVRRDVPGHDISVLLTPTCPASPAQFEADSDRYTGVAPLDGAGTIASRHYRHPDNMRAVDALMLDLQNMGYYPFRHEFEFGGRTLHNVIADLPGKGRFFLRPEIWEKLRQILIRFPLPDPPDPWLGRIAEHLGKKWLEACGIARLSPLQARWAVEQALLLFPWYPWWRKRCPLSGIGAELVIVGCHLDSTASYTPGYVPETGAAPGTDDDGSGLVATLSMARWFRDYYRRTLTHTVRFCFFNAEESGLIGSKAYASLLKAQNAPVRAVICTDMIGYNTDANRIFEIHAGYTDAAIRDLSVPIADRVAAWGASLGQLAPAQIYQGTNPSGGADRAAYDGAINRSDHAAFHQQGYPAVLASEDFFSNLASEPVSDGNPDYHRVTDRFVDFAYAADITCAVAQAVRELAA
jgi:hypothetical protein